VALNRELKGKRAEFAKGSIANKRERRFGEGYSRLPSLALAAESPEGAPGKLVSTISAPLGPWQLGICNAGPDLIAALIRPEPNSFFDREGLCLFGECRFEYDRMQFERHARVRAASQETPYKAVCIGLEA